MVSPSILSGPKTHLGRIYLSAIGNAPSKLSKPTISSRIAIWLLTVYMSIVVGVISPHGEGGEGGKGGGDNGHNANNDGDKDSHNANRDQHHQGGNGHHSNPPHDPNDPNNRGGRNSPRPRSPSPLRSRQPSPTRPHSPEPLTSEGADDLLSILPGIGQPGHQDQPGGGPVDPLTQFRDFLGQIEGEVQTDHQVIKQGGPKISDLISNILLAKQQRDETKLTQLEGQMASILRPLNLSTVKALQRLLGGSLVDLFWKYGPHPSDLTEVNVRSIQALMQRIEREADRLRMEQLVIISSELASMLEDLDDQTITYLTRRFGVNMTDYRMDALNQATITRLLLEQMHSQQIFIPQTPTPPRQRSPTPPRRRTRIPPPPPVEQAPLGRKAVTVFKQWKQFYFTEQNSNGVEIQIDVHQVTGDIIVTSDTPPLPVQSATRTTERVKSILEKAYKSEDEFLDWIDYEQWDKTKNMEMAHWIFPNDQSSGNHKDKFQLDEDDIFVLRGKQDFKDLVRRMLDYLLFAEGYDIQKQKLVTQSQRLGRSRSHRSHHPQHRRSFQELYEMLRSTWLLGMYKEYLSLERYMQYQIKTGKMQIPGTPSQVRYFKKFIMQCDLPDLAVPQPETQGDGSGREDRDRDGDADGRGDRDGRGSGRGDRRRDKDRDGSERGGRDRRRDRRRDRDGYRDRDRDGGSTLPLGFHMGDYLPDDVIPDFLMLGLGQGLDLGTGFGPYGLEEDMHGPLTSTPEQEQEQKRKRQRQADRLNAGLTSQPSPAASSSGQGGDGGGPSQAAPTVVQQAPSVQSAGDLGARPKIKAPESTEPKHRDRKPKDRKPKDRKPKDSSSDSD